MSPGVAVEARISNHIERIAVAGNPNSGKTTVFNKLTGLRQKVGNYPGVTVEKREGALHGEDIVLLDLPGAYSLSARSPDEEIARDVLLGRVEGVRRPDAVLIVIDAGNLQRNLYLATQIIEFGMPTVIAANMMDVAEEQGQKIDCRALSKALGVPVIPTIANIGKGLDEVRRALTQLTPREPNRRCWRIDPPIAEALPRIEAVMRAAAILPDHAVHGGAMLWLSDYLSGEERSRASADRFLGKLSGQHAGELRAIAGSVSESVEDPAGQVIECRYAWIAEITDRIIHRSPLDAADGETRSHTDRIDSILTHRVFGLVIFAAIMFFLFFSIFSWAEPLMDSIEAGQEGLATLAEAVIPPGPIRSLVTDGIIEGVGAVVVFFPQICILFLFLSILEDSGYMARAAFLMDRLMSRVGLHGKSFIPLLSSYACAIPGIMATRTIENRRDRFTTILVAPLMSCSARLPIYVIVIAAVFGDRTWLKAGVMFGMYALGTVTALAMALLFKKTLLAGPRPTFIMELPPYHMPQPRVILRAMWDRSKLFLTGAGTTIFAVCIIVWALSYFPRIDETNLPSATQAAVARLDPADAGARADLIAGAQLRHSFLGRLGHWIEPTIRPLGYDWRLGVGILSSFLAREVFVGTMGITFSLGEADETSGALREQLAGATWPDGRIVLTPLVGVGLMVFYVLACQCVSTLAVVRRETNSWRWPMFMFAYMTVLAYVGSLAVYQIGTRMGWG